MSKTSFAPEPALFDDNSRKLTFLSKNKNINYIKVRAFDACTFVAFGAAQIGIAGEDIIKEFNMGVIFITHDLGVIAQVADDVAVMYLGSVVEKGPVNEILKNPKHPYTKGLLNALPDINNLDAPLKPIPGNIPSPLDRPSACVFRTRCPNPTHDCKEGNIEMGLIEVEPGHWVDQCCVNCG